MHGVGCRARFGASFMAGKGMTEEIQEFTGYLRDVKRTSKNTEVSYQRDLKQMAAFLEGSGIHEVGKVTRTSLNSYVLYLEREGRAASTISTAL